MSEQSFDQIPRGIEVLVKKASVDPDFKTLLLQKRAEAAEEIGLELEPAEMAMLTAVPAAQLKTIIARTSVPQQHRRAFLGKAAAAMLAAVGLASAGSGCASKEKRKPPRPPDPKGIRPDKPPPKKTIDRPPGKPDRIPVPEGIRPDRIPPPTGSRPDRPVMGTEGGSRPKQPD